MIPAKRDVGLVILGVLIGMGGIRFAVHLIYLSIIVSLALGLYFK